MSDWIEKWTVMDGVNDYSEQLDVRVGRSEGYYETGVDPVHWNGHGKLVVRASNESGCNCTEVDLIQLLSWVKKNMPEVWSSI